MGIAVRSLRDTVPYTVPYTFAYDNTHCARYLTAMLGEMLLLEDTHPEVYFAFSEGHFSVQLSEENSFGRIEPDKCIEMTINRERLEEQQDSVQIQAQ